MAQLTCELKLVASWWTCSKTQQRQHNRPCKWMQTALFCRVWKTLRLIHSFIHSLDVLNLAYNVADASSAPARKRVDFAPWAGSCKHVVRLRFRQEAAGPGRHGRSPGWFRGRLLEEVSQQVSERALYRPRGEERLLGVLAVRTAEERPGCKTTQKHLFTLLSVCILFCFI